MASSASDPAASRPPFPPFNNVLEPIEFHNYAQDPPVFDPVSGELQPVGDECTEYEQHRYVQPTPPILLEETCQRHRFHTITDHRSQRRHFFPRIGVECIERFDQEVEVQRRMTKTTVTVRVQVSGCEKATGAEGVGDIKYLKDWTSKMEIPVELLQRMPSQPEKSWGSEASKDASKRGGGTVREGR